VEDAILRAAELVGAEADLSEGMADAWMRDGFPGQFRDLHEAIQRAVIRRKLFAMGLTPTFEVVEKLRGGALRAATFPGGRRVVCGPDGTLRDEPDRSTGRASPAGGEVVWITIEGAEGRQVLPDGSRLLWRVLPCGQGWAPELDGRERFDAAAVGKLLGVRHWHAGDRFRPLGATGSSKLQDLFTNRKVAAPDRRQRWLLCAPDGQIVWVEGLPPGDCFKVTDRTRLLLELGLERK
jgi:tRNA(Ile)-lysidine synthase